MDAIKINFDATYGELTEYGFLLIRAQGPLAFFNNGDAKKYRDFLFKKYSRRIYHGNLGWIDSHNAYIVDPPHDKVIIVDVIPNNAFWQDCRNMMRMFRLMFNVKCYGCGGLWKKYPGRRCVGCYIERHTPGIVAEVDSLINEAFNL